MARVLGPAVSQRYTGGTTAVIYTDAGGTQLADIHSYPAGTVVSGASLTIDAAGYMPRFYFPEGSRAVWYRLDGGAPVALTPDTEDDDDLGGLGSDLSPRTHAHGLQALFGAGTDGVIAFDGVTAYATFSVLAGTTYTLSRDVYGTDITVSAGVDVVTNGFRLNASGTLTIVATGVIHHDGGAAAAAVAGAAAPAGTLSASSAGGAGGTAGGAGAAGTAVAASAFGGAGGTGGTATAGGIGGAGGAVTVPTVAMGGLLTARVLPSAIVGSALTVGTARPMAPGAGGGGGGADAGNDGGGGGGGGGVVIVNARLLVNGGQIMAAGGAGAAGTAGNAGGGAGGGGGLVIVNTTNSSGAGTVTAPGGALGAGAGTGAAGAAGTAGTAVTNVWA